MSAQWAVQGATIQVTAPGPGTVMVLTPPSTKIQAGGKPAYVGDIDVLVSGISTPGPQVGVTKVTIKALTSQLVKGENKPPLVMGDKSLGTEQGQFQVGQSVTQAPIVVMVADAGQTKVTVG